MRRWIVVGISMIIFQAGVLYVMGQPPLCECGIVKLWEGVVLSEGNSQHISDWYTPSHVIHGIFFYLLLVILLPHSPIYLRILIAIGLESAWEIFENTPFIIERYREQALAQGYVGDSVLNSVTDTLAMIAGFLYARRAPVILSIALVIALELIVGFWIRDNLTLNVIQLISPSELITRWQAGA